MALWIQFKISSSSKKNKPHYRPNDFARANDVLYVNESLF